MKVGDLIKDALGDFGIITDFDKNNNPIVYYAYLYRKRPNFGHAWDENISMHNKTVTVICEGR